MNNIWTNISPVKSFNVYNGYNLLSIVTSLLVTYSSMSFPKSPKFTSTPHKLT